jgi:hypothetical protein
VRRAEHEAQAGLKLPGLGQGFGEEGVLLAPALAVQGVQPGGQGPGGFVVRRKEQVQGRLGVVHASGGVDARGQGEAHLPGAQGRARGGAAGFLEGGDARAAGFGDEQQPVLDQDAVLPLQAHHVGHRAQGHESSRGRMSTGGPGSRRFRAAMSRKATPPRPDPDRGRGPGAG